MAKPFYQINQYIKADVLRVVDERGGQVGVFAKSEAIRRAQEQDSDLILVAASANPPVAKIINFAKFKYQQQQKDAQSRKAARSVDLKEIRFTPFIADGDYQVRIKKAIEFLEDGNKVRLNVKFTGRQITRKDFGENLLKRAINDLGEYATVEREPTLQGKIMFAQLQARKRK